MDRLGLCRRARILRRRPPEFACPAKPLSLYVAMRDGCRLAVDVYLPQQRRRTSTSVEAADGPDPHALLPALCAQGRRACRHRDLARTPRNTAISSFPAAMRSSWSMCAAPARASARVTASARRPSAKTMARSPSGSSRSPGRTVSSARPASPISAPPPCSSPAPAIPA